MKNMLRAAVLVWLSAGIAAAGELESARDRQDRAALERLTEARAVAAAKAPQDALAQYAHALAASYFAEVLLELGDKANAQRAAEAGVKSAERATALKPSHAEYYRVLGTLCGQVVPANVLAGIGYGTRARDAVNRAVELDPKSAAAWLAHGIGNYYLPAAFGGGTGLAIADFRKAIDLDPQSADAWMWLGLGLRKEKNNSEARRAFARSIELNPSRVWAKKQLEKTPRE
jgi:tetratricopeptide (TPR) repeat protein